MHGRTDEGQKVITIAHPEHSSGELKIIPVKWKVKKKKKMLQISLCVEIYYVEIYLMLYSILHAYSFYPSWP